MSKYRKDIKSKSILKYILIPVCILLLLEVVVFSGVLAVGGVIPQLEQNARDILQERIINRKSFLENEMITNWSNLSLLANQINETATQLHNDGKIDITQLDQGSASAEPLLQVISDDMITNLRSLHVNGIFVVFNNHDLDNGINNKPGLHIRDLDPTSKSSKRNEDLMIVRGPSSIVKSLNISTDSAWRPQFVFSKEKSYYPFLYQPYQAAIHNNKEFTVEDLGYWSPSYSLYGDDKEVISYSIPLIDDNGNVFGVLGIEITHDYLDVLLPSDEINDSGKGIYCLAIGNGNDNYKKVFNSENFGTDEKEIEIKDMNKNMYMKNTSEKFYISMEKLQLYNSNTPYANDEWVLMAVIPNDELLAFSNNITFILNIALALTTLSGIIGSIFIAFRLSMPITRLSKQMNEANDFENVKLKKTNISEIDYLVTSIEELNTNMLDTAHRFNKIMELASVKLAAFEVRNDKSDIFITENYFEIFQQNEVEIKNMTISEFRQKMMDLKQYITKIDGEKSLFYIPSGDNFVFIELTLSEIDNGHIIGLAEDITQRVLEQNIIEYERDHDALTGLLNRRAFWREMNTLFNSKQEEIKIAAFLMVDLDNLKYINDNYGHESGDTYILKATEAFVKYSPEKTLISRISGDEFHLFFYGYDSEEEVRKLIHQLKLGIDESYMILANQQIFNIKVSGGVAWYPKDSDSIEKLQLYSDYAMYKVKHSVKGKFEDFSFENYQNDHYLNRSREEFNIMIKEEQLQYYYQPIISAKKGNIFGYEALMRSTMPTLKSPTDILELAKQEGKLKDIEILTFFKAMEGFRKNIHDNIIDKNSKIFINSIASQMIPSEKLEEFEQLYKPYLSNLVLEVTEGEKINEPYHNLKQECLQRWGAELALDDYGSGYNSEKMLLNIIPKYIKIDMDIIRRIDKDNDKQKIVENIISYAHERDMMVVAEGVETIEELKQVIKLDVDLLQGFLLAKPQQTPMKISIDIVHLIQSLNTKK